MERASSGHRRPELGATPSSEREREIQARRELHELAHLFADTYPPPEVDRVLRRLHPGAAGRLPARELDAIIALVAPQ